MGINSKVKQSYLKIGKIMAIIIGILLIVISFLILSKDYKFNDNAVEVMATIVNVEKSETTNIEVQYNVNGEQLTSKINNYSSNTKPKKNDIIKIYYNSNNPKEIKVNKDSNILGYILIVIGVVLLAFGILFKNDYI